MARIETLHSSQPTSPFYYRVIQLDSSGSFMPQRGVIAEGEKDLWFNGVPEAAPTLELAKEWLHSMVAFDRQDSPGKVVWVLGISP
jgi:hypothetical protein